MTRYILDLSNLVSALGYGVLVVKVTQHEPFKLAFYSDVCNKNVISYKIWLIETFSKKQMDIEYFFL